MKSNKCFIAAETQSRRGVCGWVEGGGTDLCVSAGGPSGDGRCGRTCRSKGSPWRTSPGSALDAGAEAAGCSPLSSPSPRQHLEHAHTHTHEEGKTNGRRVECQPCTHHIITQHIFSSLSLVPCARCANATQSQTHQTSSRTALFSS